MITPGKTYEAGDIQHIAAKNVYTAGNDEAITAVMFCTENTNVDYSIDILVNNDLKESIL